RRFTDFSPGDAIPPNDVQLFSDAQYRRGQASTAADFDPQIPAPFDPSARMEWSPVWSLREQRFKYLPTSLLYFFYQGPGQINADSKGWRAGTRLEEATGRGFPELVNAIRMASGGTIACSASRSTSISSTMPTFAICEPSWPTLDASFGS